MGGMELYHLKKMKIIFNNLQSKKINYFECFLSWNGSLSTKVHSC